MSLTRREFLRTAGAALAAPGLYRMVDDFAVPPGKRKKDKRHPRNQRSLPPEQHLIEELRFITETTFDDQVEVLLPPLHHQVVTGTLHRPRGKAYRRGLRNQLEQKLRRIEREFPPTPAGLVVTVAWGLPYFRRFLPKLGGGVEYPDYLPVDGTTESGKPAVVDAIRFPSDPGDVILEDNDVAILFRSDSLANIVEGTRMLRGSFSALMDVTSVRRGFIGGGFGGGQSLPKRMAMAAGVPGAGAIPDTAQLFMGFTSTQKAMMGAGRIANFETLPGVASNLRNGYWTSGTTMHLSHLDIDLQRWYRDFSFDDRVRASFRPGMSMDKGRQTVSPKMLGVQTAGDVLDDAGKARSIGHSGALTAATRLPKAVTDTYGEHHPAGTPVPQRADFDTLDNPFFWTSRPQVDKFSREPVAGLHFVVFAPTSTMFHRARMAMDGHFPGGAQIDLDPRSEKVGFNAVLRTTHRQNFIVPPRRHRSFPLIEYL